MILLAVASNELHFICQMPLAFFEGGRLTFNDIHYVQEGDNLIPAGETPFAKDAHFGFTASNLKDWIVEKSGGLTKRENVTSVSLKDIREGGPQAVANILESQVQGNTVIINSKLICYSSLPLWKPMIWFPTAKNPSFSLFDVNVGKVR
jgi:uncharacterized protein YgbK (DUF1537 family)